MPQLLYIDTSGNVATVAISRSGAISADVQHTNAGEQAAVINIMIEQALTKANTALSAIDGICVCAGPGSYTGLRVGLATAKGICFVTDKPLMLFNKLDLLYASFAANEQAAIVLKARTGEYFFALYNENGKIIHAPQHIFETALNDLLSTYSAGLKIITDDNDFSENAIMLSKDMPVDTAKWLPLAEKQFAEKRFDDLAYSEPCYLKSAYTTVSKN
jgi:tRNA threonylcarbamoyladenosine biosynthesis protein TsaB